MRVATSLLTGAALLAAGGLFGTQSLYPAGVALIALPLLSVAWVFAASRGLRLERDAPAGSIVEGEPFELRHRATARPFPRPGGVVRDPLLTGPHRFGFRLPDATTYLSLSGRGRRPAGAAEVSVRDPLGFWEAAGRPLRIADLLVLPRPEPVRGPDGEPGGRALLAAATGAGAAGRDQLAAEQEVDGLRPYREGSPAARIHWPTVARTGELHERRLTAGAEAERAVIVDTRAPAAADALDALIRAAASLALELARAGGCVLLAGADRELYELDPRLASWPAAHAALALIDPDEGPPAVERLGRVGAALWLSADPGPAPAASLLRLPAARRILVRPGPPGPGALFTVAGCTGEPAPATATAAPTATAGAGGGDPARGAAA